MKKHRFSISLKTTILVIMFTLVIIMLATFFYYQAGKRKNQETYTEKATALSRTVAKVVNVEEYKVVKNKVSEILATIPNKVTSDDWGSVEWNNYSANFDSVKELNEYKNLCAFLQELQDANYSDIDCIYLIYIDSESENFVYVVDADQTEPCPPGCLDPLFDFNREILTNPERGFPAYTTNTESYGWLVSAGTPIYDANEVVGYAMVDIRMGVINDDLHEMTLKLFTILMITLIIICVIAIIIIQFALIKPLHKLTKAAESYSPENSLTNHFASVDIKTNDEISELLEAMQKMETEINTTIGELMSTNRELISSQNLANEMTRLANKDALTGVGNKTAYEDTMSKLNEELKNGNQQPFGFVMIDLNDLKVNNDTYGHESGDQALKRLCQLVCDVFNHSPVYRIGGDEFVVLLRNRDYDRANHLIDKFHFVINKANKEVSGDKSKTISAAIGLAKFDASIDSTPEDVFKRADEAMYENKRAMKGSVR